MARGTARGGGNRTMRVNRSIAWVVLCAALAAAGVAGADGAAGGVNQWTLKDEARTKAKAFCSTVYMPVTDEFLLWGVPHERFEVETFSIRTGVWRNAEPAKRLPEFPKQWRDQPVSEGGQPSRVAFADDDGFERPTRTYTFHQVTYDSRRDRALFYVGGKTFSYDPKTRLWKDLKPKR